MFKQLLKFVQVSVLILKQYLRLFYNYKKARKFFIDMLYAGTHRIYDQNEQGEPANDGAIGARGIETKKITKIFPEIKNYPIHTYNKYFEFLHEKKALLVSNEELAIINSLIKLRSPGAILEFGTYRGGLTYNFWLNMSTQSTITTIDIKKYSMDPDVEKMFNDPRIERVIGATFEQSFEKKYDFIFIDAGHYYEEVKRDSELALRSLAPGGLIVWHDYVLHIPGVVTYLEELSLEKELIHIEGSSLVLVHDTGEF